MTADRHSAGGPTHEFETLVEQHYRGLYQFAYSLVRNEASACDLTQQTFYRWAEKGHQLRDPSKVKTWLYTTLHREFLQGRRRHKRFPHHELDEVADELPSVAPVMAEQIDSELAVASLATLDELYRVPLALFYLESHSYKEIAEILDIPIGTVQSRIARGKAQLYELLTRGSPSTTRRRQSGYGASATEKAETLDG